MVLHNFIREHNSEDADFARFDRDPNFMPTIPDRYKRDVVPANASDTSTPEVSSTSMDNFRDELATSLSVCWNN
jgi:hypothetical protein